MKKLLYITDQDEYVDHSFIAPLFEIYLKKYMHVDIVYFTEFKSDFERKDTHHFIMPTCYKDVLVQELIRHDIDMSTYDFVMVRNSIDIMQHILKYRDTYNYKALYRFSFPKRRVKMSCDEANNKSTMFAQMMHHIGIQDETKTINKCDAFLPTSKRMQEAFLPKVTIPTILCSPAINPHMLHGNIAHTSEEKRFIYSGTLDKVREFETVLNAFFDVKSSHWKLFISTRDTTYANDILKKYPSLQNKVEVYNAKTKDELLDLIAKADIGVALLPDIPIYNSSTPVKIFDYYSSAIPCLMTNSDHTGTIFTDCNDAWFCDFTQVDITKKIEYLLTLSKEEVIQVGNKGQTRLLDIRNYETLAETIADKLKSL